MPDTMPADVRIPPPPLPGGYRARPLDYADAQAVTDLVGACDVANVGRVEIVIEDVVSDWARPSFEPGRDGLVVLAADGSLAGEAEVWSGSRAEVNVHPDHRGRGLGAALLAWTLDQARAAGGTALGQTVVDTNLAARSLFRAFGMRERYTSWILEIAVAPGRPAPRLPDGVAIRPVASDSERRAAWQVVEDSFASWPGRARGSYEDWAAAILGRPGFEDWQLALALDGERVVGVAVLLIYPEGGWVQQLAVAESERGRGIGRGLLDHAFGVFADRGETEVGLNTDSRTGALGLYEKVGMKLVRSYTNWALEL